LRHSNRKFEKQLADNIKSDAKFFYAYAGSKSEVKSKIGPLKMTMKVTSSEQEMAHKLNKFFTTVFTKENLASVPAVQQMTC